MDETRFYQPDFVADLLKKTRDEVVGACLVTRIPDKNSIEHYLMKNLSLLKPMEILKLIAKKYSMAFKDMLSKSGCYGTFYSVRSALNHFKVDFIEVENDINQEPHLNWIIERKPDVLISSNSLYFKKKLLQVPNLCCLNRHSSLLPAYGGLWPVFHAFRNGEKYVGISVHTMESKVDQGVVLAQEKIEIKNGMTLSDLYKECFKKSSQVVLDALEKVRRNDLKSCVEEISSTYFSFPTKEHWMVFRERGGKFI